MSTMGRMAACMLICVLFSSLTTAKSKHLPSSLNQMKDTSKASESVKSAHQMDRRSVTDNRIASIPPDSYDRRMNELPFAHTFYKGRPHLPVPSQHRRPEVTSERRPDFGMNLREDLFMPLVQQQQPAGIPSFQTMHGGSKVPFAYGRPSSVQQQRDRVEKEERPKTTESRGRGLFAGVNSRRWDKSSLPLIVSRPLEPLALMPEQNPEANFWGSDRDEGVRGQEDAGKSSLSSSETYPVLDPFFLSGIDLENIPEEDANLGDAVLAEMLGSVVPAPASEVSKLDDEADDIMADFLTFLDLRASGALDSCLNKAPKRK